MNEAGTQLTMAQIEAERPVVRQELHGVGKGVLKPMAALTRFYKRMDTALARVPEKLACDGGCSYCCHYHVYVTALEVFGLAEFINTQLDEEVREQVKNKLLGNVQRVSTLSVDEHIKTNVACALLSDAGRCLAYPIRPSACHRHHSLNAKACEVTFNDPLSSMQNILSAQHQAIADGFFAAAAIETAHMSADFARYEMNSALNEALTNPACFKRWKAGKASFPSVRDRDATGGMGS